MPMQVKSRRSHTTPKRRTPLVSGRTVKASQVRASKTASHHNHHHTTTAPSPYQKAMRYLASLADFERLRIVRYNSDNFNLDRMRLLLKRMDNPQDQFKSVHVAGTKGKGSTCS